MSKKPTNNQAEIEERRLVADIIGSESSDKHVATTLRTDERVIARVTDGIYRRPGSALRELISNAYDADASRVVIKTDAPRFDRITIEDDGHGMSPEALAHMLLHIGGSAKRSEEGESLGVTAPGNSLYSPGGRRLIGKIGIGLFSVSQLTQSFQIITKTKGDRYRTVATITLRQYSDDQEEQPHNSDNKKYESGKVNIWRERATDTESQGTTIVLTAIRTQARDTLRSRDIWATIEQAESEFETENVNTIEPPKFHIGKIWNKDDQMLEKIGSDYSSLPWNRNDPPDKAFEKLVEAVWDQIGPSGPNPKLERIFDYYLNMAWQLALAVPVPYVGAHPFDLCPQSQSRVFKLSNKKKGSPTECILQKNQSIREALNLTDGTSETGVFDVILDDLKLVRPIKFDNLPRGSGAIQSPLIFTGKVTEEFSKFPVELSGGPLEFEAYLFWTPKIAPTEHQGALVRIHGSSGTLFDPTFLNYQTAELVRLRQITCEVYVHRGLDSALNIDRESFNAAHPHSVYIAKWLHSALRQLASTQKKIAQEIRHNNRHTSRNVAVGEIQQIANEVWTKETGDADSTPPEIELIESSELEFEPSRKDAYIFDRKTILPSKTANKQSAKQIGRGKILEQKIKSIAQVLASFGLLDAVPKKKQEELLQAIYKILNAPEE
jgi:hypothetical protein